MVLEVVFFGLKKMDQDGCFERCVFGLGSAKGCAWLRDDPYS